MVAVSSPLQREHRGGGVRISCVALPCCSCCVSELSQSCTNQRSASRAGSCRQLMGECGREWHRVLAGEYGALGEVHEKQTLRFSAAVTVLQRGADVVCERLLRSRCGRNSSDLLEADDGVVLHVRNGIEDYLHETATSDEVIAVMRPRAPPKLQFL